MSLFQPFNIKELVPVLSNRVSRFDTGCSLLELLHRCLRQLPPVSGLSVSGDLAQRLVSRDAHNLVRCASALGKAPRSGLSQTMSSARLGQPSLIAHLAEPISETRSREGLSAFGYEE